MADSLNPWLLPYLTGMAESYGARIENIARHEKGKKVQILEFLTYGTDAQDTYVWARVSDKQYTIPVKFSKEAVINYASKGHPRLTQQKGAIVSIKSFRPMLSRLPCGPGGVPTSVAYLALEADFVSPLSCSGAGKFGNPTPITENVDMQAWAEGLNQAGGAGNILKDRRNERIEQEQVAESSTSAQRSTKSVGAMLPPAVPTSTTAPQRPPTLKKGGGEEKNRGFWVGYRTEITDMASYNERWKNIIRNPHARFRPDENTLAAAKSAEIPEPESPPNPSPMRSRSATPISDWDMTQSSPARASAPVSSLSLPTPAQRRKRPSNTSREMASSSPRGDETMLDIEPPILQSQSQDVSKFKRPVARKVPRPASPKSVKHDGPARVLAPNSDTSGTQSQSQPQTQSQPHVQEQGEPMIIDVEAVNEESRTSQQAQDANQGAEKMVEDEKGEDEHAAEEAAMIDEEAPRGSKASPHKPGPMGSERAGTRVSGCTREGAERGAGAEDDEDGGHIADDGGDGAERGAEEGRAERWPWMDLWAVRAVAAATREARLGNS